MSVAHQYLLPPKTTLTSHSVNTRMLNTNLSFHAPKTSTFPSYLTIEGGNKVKFS